MSQGTQDTTLHGPTEKLEDVQRALERAGWTVTNVENGGPLGHVTVEGDHPDLDHLTGPSFGYYNNPDRAFPGGFWSFPLTFA